MTAFESDVKDRQPEELSLDKKLKEMSASEREALKLDALEKYNELENLIHAIARFEDSNSQDVLF